MASSFAKFKILGNVGKDPELEEWNGTPRTRINIAHTEKWKDQAGQKQEKTNWFSITAWRKSATLLTQYVKRGDKLYVEGKLTTREAETDHGDKYRITNFTVTDFSLLGSSGGSGNNKPAQGTDNYNNYNNDEAPPF